MEINIATLHQVVKTMPQWMLNVIKDKGNPTNKSVWLLCQAVYIDESLCLHMNIKVYCYWINTSGFYILPVF